MHASKSRQSLRNKVKAMVGADSSEEKTRGPLWQSGPRKLLSTRIRVKLFNSAKMCSFGVYSALSAASLRPRDFRSSTLWRVIRHLRNSWSNGAAQSSCNQEAPRSGPTACVIPPVCRHGRTLAQWPRTGLLQPGGPEIGSNCVRNPACMPQWSHTGAVVPHRALATRRARTRIPPHPFLRKFVPLACDSTCPQPRCIPGDTPEPSEFQPFDV